MALGASALVLVPADQPTLQDAIAAVTDGGVIEIAAGTYTAPSGSFTILDYSKGFTIRAASGAAVTLSGGGATDIIRFSNSPGRQAHTITFDRLTFSAGLSTQDFIGGALTIVRNNAVFSSCVFTNNGANPSTTGGGALWLDTAVVSFQDCTWTNNTSKNYGGAISMLGSRVFLRGCGFVGNRVNLPNHAPNAPGGAIFNSDSSLQVDNCRFDNNQAGYAGGAIYCGGHWKDPITTPTVDLLVNNSLFTGNAAVRDPSVAATSAPLGGALHLEDQTTARFFNSRFENNHAAQGGAVSNYRSITEVQNCIFNGNYAVGSTPGEGIGGAIIALSDDNPDSSTANGTINRRSASLTVRDSVFRGSAGGASNGLDGGGIFVGGDLNAQYGRGGVTQNGTEATNRAVLNLTRVSFADLSTSGGAIPGSAGAIGGAFVTLIMDGCIIENCSTTHLGGGIELVQNSACTIKNSTIAQCRAGSLGGALAMFGGTIDLHDSNLIENQSTGGAQGAAMVTAPAPASDGLPSLDISGLVQNCIFSNNTGSPTIWEGDRVDTPFNRMQYGSNQIFTTGDPAFYSQISGPVSVDELNLLDFLRNDLSHSKKAPSANAVPASAPVVGTILMAPTTVLQSGAPGETLPIPSNLVYAASGGSVALDGVGQTANSGIVSTVVDGVHTLTVGSLQFNTPPSPPGFAANISTRLPVGTDQNVLIGGFIIQGSTPKRVIIRGIGPSLNGAVAGALQDPVLELHNGAGALIASNDNWRTTQIGGVINADQSIDIIATSIAPSSEAEPAIVITLDPGAYTAIVRGVNNTTGIALVEVYDLDASPSSTLANVSTRGFIQTGDNVMIGGFIYLGGAGATKVVVRGIGPSLSAAGITNPLSEPMLELHDGNGTTISSNDGWKSSPDAAAIQGVGLQPTNDSETAIYKTGLPRGPYTAIVRGKNSGIGVGVVEAYIFQ